ncbi:hypothetical protein VNI00_002355 [Paramarasmius palmivorus]|uniref:Heterokaryon incompatibility domain-containing protein n=1 Tax=Paramarasmius palmivorus TaxID=297713 RepID=A0AAW0DZE9_9AGAR
MNGLIGSLPFASGSLVDEDFRPALEDISDSLEDTTMLPRLVTALSDLASQLKRVDTQSTSETTADLCDSIETIRLLLVGHHQNWDLASAIPNHRGVSGTAQPQFMVELLKELHSHVRHVIVVIQSCQASRFRFWNQGEVEELRECAREIKHCQKKFQAHLCPIQIYKEPLSSPTLSNITLHVMDSATPERYRLVDCLELCKGTTLCIQEFIHFPLVPYAAVSYVWRGNSVSEGYNAAEFSVTGAEEADPIGVDVLHDACTAALALGASHLWIDRLCIMQTSKLDKNWQIREMYHMYKSCKACIVLPGGLRRLVSLGEETGWIHRGWTLQEALAPHAVRVLFAWKLGSCKARSGDGDRADLEQVLEGRSAMAPLSLLLDGCTTGYLSIEIGDKSTMVEAKLFSAQGFNYSYRDIPFWRPTRRIMAPNVSALAIAMSVDMNADEKRWAIWQSALMRTSSRPVDMIFSIMGLFGVTLDTSALHKNDRIGATIALAQQILKEGGRANWLGVSFHVAPCPQLSTFPTFPRTRVSGKALVRVEEGKYREVSELMESEYPIAEALVPMPLGSMDDDGYLTFTAKSMRILSRFDLSTTLPHDNVARPSHVTALDGSTWKLCDNTDAAPSVDIGEAWMVLLGFFSGYFPGATSAVNDKNIRALLVEQHAQGKFHVRNYFMLSSKARAWVGSWSEHSFSIGGPRLRQDVLETPEDTDEIVTEITVVNEELLSNTPTSSRTAVTLREHTERKARWAIPQSVLESSQHVLA